MLEEVSKLDWIRLLPRRVLTVPNLDHDSRLRRYALQHGIASPTWLDASGDCLPV